ncbi:MAG: hypothetical protein U9R74_01365 [Pseudomonadota bacterium]|nr:hypothetical protein [Pseudomonadota bacterium]
MSDDRERLKRLDTDLNGIPPYPGLRPFLDDESQFFKGREAQVREVGRRLANENCVTVLGGSGCGKSSIVRAGVVPALRRKLIPGRGDLWRVAIFMPGAKPIDNLVRALELTLRGQPQARAPADRRARDIRRVLYGPSGLGGFLPAFLDQLDIDPGLSPQTREHANLLVVIDQFEELFRAEVHGKPQVARLVALVIDYWKRRSEFPGLYLTVTIRSDDLHRCAEFIELPDFINATSFLTRRLEEVELREAIVAPIRPPIFRAGLIKGELPPGEIDLRPFEVRVVTELLDATQEIAYDPDHLPLLQHLLSVLWRQVRARWEREAQAGTSELKPVITLDDLAEALGFEDWGKLVNVRDGEHDDGWLLRCCLRYTADQMYQGDRYGPALTAVQRRVAETALCLMGEIDDRGNCKRRYTTREEIVRVAGRTVTDDDVDAFVRRFYLDHRLIWLRRDGLMDVSHESLMRNWTRLRSWLRQDCEAGKAYRELSEHYKEWRQSPRRLLRSWFDDSGGLLGRDTLARLVSQLALDSRPFRVVPRYTAAWARRYEPAASTLAATSSNAVSGYGTTPEAAAKSEAEFAQRFRHLRKMKRWNEAIKALPLVIVILIAGWGWHVALQQQELAEQIAKGRASELWDGFSAYRFNYGHEYVDNLWRLVGADSDVRKFFVAQMVDGGNLNELGSNPLPIIRAVGLRWPEEERQQFSNRLQQELSKDRTDVSWSEAMLACATAALSDRLDEQCRKAATNRFQQFIAQPEMEKTDWAFGRVLACVGPELYAADEIATRKVFDSIFSETAEDNFESTSGLAVATRFFTTDGRQLSADQEETLKNAMPKAIESLEVKATKPWAIKIARSLVSLIATSPREVQIDVLERLLSVTNEWPANGDPAVILALAQAFEIVARQHAGEEGGLDRLADRAHELLKVDRNPGAESASSSPGSLDFADAPERTPYQARRNQIFVARMLAPLVEATCTRGPALETLAGTAGFNVPLNCQSIHPVRMEQEDNSKLQTGLKARVLALAVKCHCQGSRETARTTVDGLLGYLSQSSTPRDSQYSFSREAIARALAAVAVDPEINEKQREKALTEARIALAETWSAEEAAAWADAITQLLRFNEDVDFAEQLVEVLKYPNSALTAREPNAIEPKSATDIFVASLKERLKLEEAMQARLSINASPRIMKFRQVLDQLVNDPRFKHIRLETRPEDPRRAGDAREKPKAR